MEKKLVVRRARDIIAEQKQHPDPVSLWMNGLWNENEIHCLFADTNIGKSILAVQIARDITEKLHKSVIYFDFELSDKQFQLRYTSDDGEHVYPFRDSFMRASYNAKNIENAQITEQDIIDIVTESESSIIIIDNLISLESDSTDGMKAAQLMKMFMRLKIKYGLSILVIAHTPKRKQEDPMTLNDLKGSNAFSIFLDSASAVNKTALSDNGRYIKQLKCRQERIIYGEDNVIVCHIEKNDAFTEFIVDGFTTEEEALIAVAPEERRRQALADDIIVTPSEQPADQSPIPIEEYDPMDIKIMQMHGKGISIRNIAKHLNLSKTTVQRKIEKLTK